MRTLFNPKTLKFFVLTSISAITLVLFVGTLCTTTTLYEGMLSEQAQKTSRGISLQTYTSILQLMRMGASHEDLQEFVRATKNAHKDTPYTVAIYRGALVAQQSGPPAEGALPPEIRQTFATGETTSYNHNGSTHNVYPLKAEAMCLRCHSRIKTGEVLGVVEVAQSLHKIAAEMRSRYTGLFVGYGLLVLLTAAGLATVVVKRIGRTVTLFQTKTAAINSVDDLNLLDLGTIDFGFEELNTAFLHVEGMVQRLQEIAVDKEILSLKIKMSNKLIITSNMIHNWHKFVMELLADIHRIVPIYAIAAVCQDDGHDGRAEIFWLNNQSPATKERMEGLFCAQLAGTSAAAALPLANISHHVTDLESFLPELEAEDIAIHAKTLTLELPKMRGVVAIAVPAQDAADPTRRIVTESILTTLLNLVGSVHAISKYTKDLEYYATRDPLTHLHNQRMFWELLEYEVGRATRHAYRFAVLVIDMDNFKLINDLYGHAFGDTYLKAFAGVLRQASREGDFVARYGGDEFAILLPETTQEQAYLVAKRMSTMINEMRLCAPDHTMVTATSSIGVAVFPMHAQSARDLFLVADNMMYKAKKGGKNAIALPDAHEIGQIVNQHDNKKRMIIKAIDEDRIVPFFQPIVRYGAPSAQIHELLMRIQEGDTFIPAGEFIELAESMGVLHRMDYMLIEKAFAMAQQADYQGYLFINISPRVFINGEFIAWLRKQTRAYGLEPEQIVLEITERETVKNLALVETLIHTLTQDGYKFAIDDFGSGFSSYQYLKRFPVDFIKIEGEFIRSLPFDREYKAFVKSIVTLAQELNVRAIAEFVENAEIDAALQEYDIDYGQGYYLGRPGPTLGPKPHITPTIHEKREDRIELLAA